MIRNINKPFAALVALLAVYNFVFWDEKLGLNIVIFTMLLCSALIYINPAALRSQKALIALCGVIYCSLMVLVNNSSFSKFTLITGTMLFAGFAHQPEIKSFYASFLTYTASYFMIPVTVIEGIIKTKQKNKTIRTIYTVVKLGAIPILVFFIFYAMYAVASPKFSMYTHNIIDDIYNYLEGFFKNYPVIRFVFIFSGFLILCGVLYNKNIQFFKKYDLMFREKISHDKLNKLVWLNNGKRYLSALRIFRLRMNSLMTEYKIGLILLVLMNILILGLNIVDIKFLWLNFDPSEISGLADYVHQGTYVLIFSIALSMIILLFFFRGNLNFYSKNKALNILSITWMAQNAFMAVSVGLRDYYYVIYIHAISYKRIGVIIYLILTIIGLITMVMKITQKRSAYNILKINSWAVFIVFLLMSSFNWDTTIAEYNLANPSKYGVDVIYLLSLGDDVLPLLDKNKELMKDKIYKQKWNHTTYALDKFNDMKLSFLSDRERYTWLSWNLADNKIYEHLKNSENIKPTLEGAE